MNGIRRLIVFFFIALSLPLGYLAFHAFRSLANEEAAALGYFAETLFDEVEQSLAGLIRREEDRPIDAYGAAPGAPDAPLSGVSPAPFIRGYFQNNPDGTFQAPLSPAAPGFAALQAELGEVNRIFNRKRAEATDRIPAEAAVAPSDARKKDSPLFAEKYLDLSRARMDRGHLGEKESKQESVTARQALSVSGKEPQAKAWVEARRAPPALEKREAAAIGAQQTAPAAPAPEAEPAAEADAVAEGGRLQVEVAPFQAVFIDEARVFVFRRILIEGQMYRQGFVLQVEAFLAHLAGTHFIPQPLARYTRLRLRAVEQGRDVRVVEAGAPAERSRFAVHRTFPPPFAFVRADLFCEDIPRSAARGTLSLMLAALVGVLLLGLVAIYASARKIVDYSERQARFVSSVTHELKTPLTNIRMYIEMLEQGMAGDPEREREYYRVLDSEGARLSRLIENVLELSRLERRHRRPDLRPGGFEDVIDEVERLMAGAARQAGFTLKRANRVARPFRYDREIMVQVLINLVENSLKFGRDAEPKAITIGLREEGGRVRIEVADTGPGIPPADLKKVFNDFHRADHPAARAAGGTGIGLALVKRFVKLVGGQVAVSNNDGPGCTFTITLPE
jgi:signal transduction histidine kinase